MMCKKPFRKGVMEFGCGQCMPCRIDRRRLWSTRLMLEARKHGLSLFVTLTYAKEWLADGATLVPKHMQDYLKRLRFHCDPIRVRFYGVGEYGERFGRPHYHLSLFGADDNKFLDAVKECWTFGSVDVRLLSWDLAWYIVGYICKRFTKHGGDVADKWLAGRHPEFARMSLRPGIGAEAMVDLAQALNCDAGVRAYLASGDVPYVVKVQGKTLPLGRYLVRKLRDECGYPMDTPDRVLAEKAAELYVEKQTVELRDERESRRVQSGRNAEARWLLSNSKRSL